MESRYGLRPARLPTRPQHCSQEIEEHSNDIHLSTADYQAKVSFRPGSLFDRQGGSNLDRREHDKVFPGSALPSISDVQAAYLDVYELLEFRRIGKDYARTLAVWCERLEASRDQAIDAFGEATFNHYVHYFKAAERSFDAGVTDLLQVSLRPLN